MLLVRPKRRKSIAKAIIKIDERIITSQKSRYSPNEDHLYTNLNYVWKNCERTEKFFASDMLPTAVVC